jgi:hypothetical protein
MCREFFFCGGMYVLPFFDVDEKKKCREEKVKARIYKIDKNVHKNIQAICVNLRLLKQIHKSIIFSNFNSNSLTLFLFLLIFLFSCFLFCVVVLQHCQIYGASWFMTTTFFYIFFIPFQLDVSRHLSI